MLALAMWCALLRGARGLRGGAPPRPAAASRRAAASRGATTPPTTFPRTKEGIPDGVCAVYKPPGWTSANVVAKVRTTLQKAIRVEGQPKKKFKVKVGHGGTLDPAARGVLVLGVGAGCRQLEGYLAGGKEYRAVGKLGEATDTLDGEGNVTETAAWAHVTRRSLEDALPDFRGEIWQTPPMYSALHHDGKRLHELARAGVEVERPQRKVTVSRLELDFGGVGDHPGPLARPYFGLDCEVSGGTYIRTLIDDLARELGTVGHMVELERTRQGPFDLVECLDQAHWDDFDRICQHVVDSRVVLAWAAGTDAGRKEASEGAADGEGEGLSAAEAAAEANGSAGEASDDSEWDELLDGGVEGVVETEAGVAWDGKGPPPPHLLEVKWQAKRRETEWLDEWN